MNLLNVILSSVIAVIISYFSILNLSNDKFDLKKYRMWAIMSAKYAVSGRRFHQRRSISLS